MPGAVEMAEMLRKRRAAQLQAILQGGGQAPMTMPPLDTSLAPAQGSKVLGLISPGLASLGQAAVVPQAQQMTFSSAPQGGAASAGVPGAAPLSPPPKQNQSLQQVIALLSSLAGYRSRP